MSQFAVGEIAIYCRAGSLCSGTEVTILALAREMGFLDHFTGKMSYALCYEVKPHGTHFDPKAKYVAEPHHLRKRRPPQDWDRLCKLQDVPVVRPKEIA